MSIDATSEPDPAADCNRTESTILEMFTAAGRSELWLRAEVAREVGGEIAAADALDSLYRAGLIHRTSDGFFFATRATIRAGELRL